MMTTNCLDNRMKDGALSTIELNRAILNFLSVDDNFIEGGFVDILVLRKSNEIIKHLTGSSTTLHQISHCLQNLENLGLVKSDSKQARVITKCKITEKGFFCLNLALFLERT